MLIAAGCMRRGTKNELHSPKGATTHSAVIVVAVGNGLESYELKANGTSQV